MRRTILSASITGLVVCCFIWLLNRVPAPDRTSLEAAVESIDFDQLYADMLAAPPKVWHTDAIDPDEQRREFRDWFEREQMSFPVTRLDAGIVVMSWFNGPAREVIQTVESQNGARYSVHLDRHAAGAECYIKFAGAAARDSQLGFDGSLRQPANPSR